jgi:hypothetical protein
MSLPNRPETITRIVVGAMVGLFVGVAIVVGTASFYAKSTGTLVLVVGLSAVLCAFLGWLLGDRFFHTLHKWIQWF